MNKICYIIAGPNGAGKTTFATTFLPEEGECFTFINADLIAAGLSPLKPEAAAIKAGRLMLEEIEEAVNSGESFAFETTLSGLIYRDKIKLWQNVGYQVVLYYLKLQSVELALERVRYRVSKGGHNIPERDVRRRYVRSWKNFEGVYRELVDEWRIYDTSGDEPLHLT